MFRREAEAAGLRVMVDSAAMIDYHTGKLPDKRAIQTLKKHGLEVTHRARPVSWVARIVDTIGYCDMLSGDTCEKTSLLSVSS